MDDAIDTCIAELLERARVTGPPVDALVLAERLGVRIAIDEAISGRARTKRIGQRAVVFLRPDDRPERWQWSVAHELGEIHAWRFAGPDVEPGEREQLANRFAGRLLLPDGWFREAVAEHDRRLPDLKRTFATASHELIGIRLVDLPEPCVVTVFDNGRVVRRHSSRPPVPIQPFERTCWQRCRERGEPIDATSPGVRVQCWPIHEPEWQREIVVATALEEW